MTAAERAQLRLQAQAARFEGPLRDAYLRAVAALTPDDLAAIARLIESGGIDAAVDAILRQPATLRALDAIRVEYGKALTTLTQLTGRDLSIVLRVELGTKVLTPSLVAALRRWEDDAFARIAADLRAGLRETIVGELAKGIGPRQIAVALKSPISGGGLTAYDVGIIRSFRDALSEGRYTDALGRTLRDRRFDAVLKRLRKLDGRLTPEQVDRMVAAYRRKLVAWRAETFARTAAVQAANDAQREAWQQRIEAGTVQADAVRRFWVTAQDERLCERCEPIPSLNPDGVGFDEPFRTPDDGFVDGPQLHPNCRCTVWYREARAGVRPRPAPGVNVLRL